MKDESLIRWFYDTVLQGHETPILAIIILTLGGIAVMAWKGWIRFGPPRVGGMAVNTGMSAETRRHLYGADGMTKYVPRTECIMNRENCEGGICNAIESLEGKVEEVRVTIGEKEADRTKEAKDLAFFMGRVDEYMRKNGG